MSVVVVAACLSWITPAHAAELNSPGRFGSNFTYSGHIRIYKLDSAFTSASSIASVRLEHRFAPLEGTGCGAQVGPVDTVATGWTYRSYMEQEWSSYIPLGCHLYEYVVTALDGSTCRTPVGAPSARCVGITDGGLSSGVAGGTGGGTGPGTWMRVSPQAAITPAIEVVHGGPDTTAARVTEGGATDSVGMRLSMPPISNVTITVTHGSQVGLDRTELVFTPTNWNQLQYVTITAVDDTVDDDGVHDELRIRSSSSDPRYQGTPVSPVPVWVTDNDSPPVAPTPVVPDPVDPVPPVIPGPSRAPGVTLQDVMATTYGLPYTLRWWGTDPDKDELHYLVQRQSGSQSRRPVTTWTTVRTTAATTWRVNAPARGTYHCWRVIAVDSHGVRSRPSLITCTSTPWDDRDLTLTGSWSDTTIRGGFRGTGSVAGAAGGQLRIPVHGSSISIGYAPCATCGRASIYVGSRLLSRTNLTKGVATEHQIRLPAHTAPITVRIVADEGFRLDSVRVLR